MPKIVKRGINSASRRVTYVAYGHTGVNSYDIDHGSDQG
jgi:hypothetical protein